MFEPGRNMRHLTRSHKLFMVAAALTTHYRSGCAGFAVFVYILAMLCSRCLQDTIVQYDSNIVDNKSIRLESYRVATPP